MTLPRFTSKRARLNHALKSRGFTGLDDARVLLEQISVTIRSHNDFRSLLMTVEPAERRNCYESMASRLCFTPHPLSVYEAEARSIAAARESHNDPPLNIIGVAERALKAESAGGTLRLTCGKCLTFVPFFAESRDGALFLAREAGWAIDPKQQAEPICPKCAPKPLI